MLRWLEEHEGLLWGATVVSVLVFVVSVVVVPLLAARIPADYFAQARRPRGEWGERHEVLRWVVRVGKNVLGVLLIVAGAAMLVLPGQGIATMIVGFLLMDFPGKYGIEKRLVRRAWVRRPVDWLRRRRGAAALEVEAGRDADGAHRTRGGATERDLRKPTG